LLSRISVENAFDGHEVENESPSMRRTAARSLCVIGSIASAFGAPAPAANNSAFTATSAA